MSGTRAPTACSALRLLVVAGLLASLHAGCGVPWKP